MSIRYSVLIPALNEAENIAQTIQSARDALGMSLEIIVADGGSVDETVIRARNAGAKILLVEARGRGLQLDAALHAARGDVCVILHADTLLPSDARRHIELALSRADAGAFRLKFDGDQLRWLAFAINARSRLLKSATGDQAMFARRDMLLLVGGIPQVELFEDVRLWRALKRAGRTTLVRAKVTTSARLWIRFGTGRTIFLHWRLSLLHRLGMSPRKLARMYPTWAA